jgi:hypothetical protein
VKKLILLFFIVSCSSVGNKIPTDYSRQYNYQDVSGSFHIAREKKTVNKKVVTRLIMSSPDRSKLFEKSIMLSQPGSVAIKGKKRTNTFRPVASDYEVWLDGKLQRSSLRIDLKAKSMKATVSRAGVEKKTQNIKFTRHQQFCFYNQIAECLAYNGILATVLSTPQTRDFIVVWDNWPYHQDMLSGVSSELFTPATARYEGKDREGHRVAVDISGQLILYHFDESNELKKMAWMSQGISLTPIGQEISKEME